MYQTKDSYTAAYHYLTCATTAQATPTSTKEVAALVAKQYQSARSGAPVTLRTSRPRFHSTASFVCPTSTAAAVKGSSTPAVTTEAGQKAAQAGSGQQVGILQTQMNKVLAVDAAKNTMRVQAGMTIAELLKAATQSKMSVQVMRGVEVQKQHCWLFCLQRGARGQNGREREGRDGSKACRCPNLCSTHLHGVVCQIALLLLQIGSVPAYAELTLGGVLATSAHGSG